MQAYQQKTEKFFVIEEKKFGAIDSCGQFHKHFMSIICANFLALKNKKAIFK